MAKAQIILGAVLAAAALGASQVRASAQPAQVMVFFDWGKPDLTRDGAATLDGVAGTLQRTPGGSLRLTGHSDRSGAASHNQNSSLRRAEAVRDYLVERGVPRAAMTIMAFGEERPLVPTEDGVREVQNRRVEIAFGPGANLP